MAANCCFWGSHMVPCDERHAVHIRCNKECIGCIFINAENAPYCAPLFVHPQWNYKPRNLWQSHYSFQEIWTAWLDPLERFLRHHQASQQPKHTKYEMSLKKTLWKQIRWWILQRRSAATPEERKQVNFTLKCERIVPVFHVNMTQAFHFITRNFSSYYMFHVRTRYMVIIE